MFVLSFVLQTIALFLIWDVDAEPENVVSFVRFYGLETIAMCFIIIGILIGEEKK